MNKEELLLSADFAVVTCICGHLSLCGMLLLFGLCSLRLCCGFRALSLSPFRLQLCRGLLAGVLGCLIAGCGGEAANTASR
jgi:hypothetical protein